MSSFAQWINDWRWVMNVKRARTWRRGLGFSARLTFDRTIRPPIYKGIVIDYPDALYHITIDDLCRAIQASGACDQRDAAQQSAKDARALLVEAGIVLKVERVTHPVRARIEAFLEPKV